MILSVLEKRPCNSSVELLRILSMTMIVMFHFYANVQQNAFILIINILIITIFRIGLLSHPYKFLFSSFVLKIQFKLDYFLSLMIVVECSLVDKLRIYIQNKLIKL